MTFPIKIISRKPSDTPEKAYNDSEATQAGADNVRSTLPDQPSNDTRSAMMNTNKIVGSNMAFLFWNITYIIIWGIFSLTNFKRVD